jgi:acyl-CoA synthetase (AMP-forming)/AMP-acid ligase II
MGSKQILTCDSLRDLVAARYRDLPQSTALLSKHEPLLTYAGLNAQIDRIGSVLRAHKITHNDRVAIVLPNGLEMAATFLGVACYSTCAPLNPAYGPAELEFYLTDLAAKAVVTSVVTVPLLRSHVLRLGDSFAFRLIAFGVISWNILAWQCGLKIVGGAVLVALLTRWHLTKRA